MSEAQKQAQQARRERERTSMMESAASVANSAAEAIPDSSEDSGTQDSAADASKQPERQYAFNDRLQALMQMREQRVEADEAESQPSDAPEEYRIPAETDPTVIPSDEPVNVVVAQPDVPAVTADATPATADAQPEMVKAKVNGEDFEVPQSEVDAAGGLTNWQKNKAADMRLDKSKQRENQELDQLRSQVAQMEQLVRQLAPAKAEQPARTAIDIAKEKAPLLQYGNPDEAAAALNEIIAAAVPKIDQDAIIRQTMAAVSMQTAAQEFVRDNPDIVKHPFGPYLAQKMEAEVLSKGMPRDFQAFYKNLAVTLRNGLGLQNPTGPSATSVTTPNPTVTVADKLARKADIVALPTASARAPAPEEQKPMTREERLAFMRKARGQPT